jgi:hypothetical protein
VEESTPQDKSKLILKQLPKAWHAKVVIEENKRAKGKYMVRMTGLPNVHPKALHSLLEDATQNVIDKVTPTTQGFLITCTDPTTQNKVMGLSGHILDDHVIKCSRVDHKKSPDEVADFITARLQVEQKVQAIRETYDEPPKTQMVQQVRETSTTTELYTNSNKRNNSKGGKGNPKGNKPTQNSPRQNTPPSNTPPRTQSNQTTGPASKPHQSTSSNTSQKHCQYCAEMGREAAHSPRSFAAFKVALGIEKGTH